MLMQDLLNLVAQPDNPRWGLRGRWAWFPDAWHIRNDMMVIGAMLQGLVYANRNQTCLKLTSKGRTERRVRNSNPILPKLDHPSCTRCGRPTPERHGYTCDGTFYCDNCDPDPSDVGNLL